MRPEPRLLLVSVALLAACGDDAGPNGDGPADAADTRADTPDAASDVAVDSESDEPPEPDVASGDAVSDDTDSSPDAAPPARRCNGHEDFCDRTLAELTLAGTHNAMSNEEDGFIGPNQTHGLRRQLDDGIRAMLLDTYRKDDRLVFCHSDCVWGSSDAVEQLTLVRDFLDEFPDEVLVFIFQDAIEIEDTVELLERSGLAELVWTPPASVDEWPTLGEMLDAGQRVVVSLESGRSGSEWALDAWELFFDTPYSFERVEDFSCVVNRGDESNPLYLVNHWLGRPLSLPFLADEANTYDVLYGRVTACSEERGRRANVVAVDFYERGDLFEVVDVLNGVRPPR